MTPGGTQELGQLDTLFETLSGRERRRALYYLREHGTATKRELVDVLTGWTATDREGGATTPDDWTRTQVTLHHVHLPRLVDADLVTYDPETGVIRLLDLPPWIERCLDAAFEGDQSLAATRGQPTESVSDEPNRP